MNEFLDILAYTILASALLAFAFIVVRNFKHMWPVLVIFPIVGAIFWALIHIGIRI